MRHLAIGVLAGVLGFAGVARAAGPPNEALLEAQRKALAALARYDGEWRGEATVYNPDGTTLKPVQTGRYGPSSWPAAGAVGP